MVSLLDGGWRIVNGQIPHTTFHVPVGSLTYLLAAFGMKIVAPSASSLTYGSVLFATLLLPCAWYIASTRLPWAFAFIFVFFQGFLLLTPRPLGYPLRFTTYAMMYNRQGYVLLSLLLLCVFLKPRNLAGKRVLRDGLLAGILLALMLYCKITYFAVAVAFTLLAVVLDAKPPRWYFAFAGAFAGMCAGFFVFFHINLYAYALDVLSSGRVQSPGMRTALLFEVLDNNAIWIYMLVFCVALCTLADVKLARQGYSTLRLSLVTGAIVAGALLISSGNANQGGGVDDPMYFLAAVIFLELFRRQNADLVAQSDSTARWAYSASWALMLPVFCGIILARDVVSCAYSIKWNIDGRPAVASSQHMHSASLRDFYISPWVWKMSGYWPVSDFPARMDNGIALLQNNLQKGDRVTTVAFANPFSFALGLPPDDDYFLFWDMNFTFDYLHFPPPEKFLGCSSLVMVPQHAARDLGHPFQTPDQLLVIYGDYLHSHFHEVASTDTWALYRRNSE